MKKQDYSKTLATSFTARGVKRRRRRIRRAIVSLLCLALAGGAALGAVNLAVAQSAKRRILTPEGVAALEGADCIIVLGAQVWADGSPSPILADRVRRGVELYQQGAAPVLLMSGDHGQISYDEVSGMKQYAVNSGVPSADIFMDHAGFSTYETMYRARDVFQAKKVIIVTQRYHLFRAVYIARRLGLDAYGVGADYQAFANQPFFSTREFAARVKDFAMCVIKPPPTYLGEAIPLNLSGDVTNDEGVVFVSAEVP
ncbi:MAG: YdcF family protein [Oscillospiraceae bacterium]|nr:YdcF family protein [Oscillospiraceae bacterium]